MKELCKKTMINAYNWISFSPEKRGESDFNYYTKLLESDLIALGENQGNYREKFIDKIMTYFHRLSSCTSPMIAGPANFNVRRNNKKNDSAQKAWDDFNHWREKYFKAVNRERTLSPEEEIDKAREEIDRLLITQMQAKETNKILRKFKIEPIERGQTFNLDGQLKENEQKAVADLLDLYNDDRQKVAEILSPNCYGGIGFMSFELTSLNNKIKERTNKIKIMQSRIETKETFKPIHFKGGFVTIENDRVIIKHDEKPNREVIDAIKAKGFRWAPSVGNWCRKHTQNALWDAENLVDRVFGGRITEEV